MTVANDPIKHGPIMAVAQIPFEKRNILPDSRLKTVFTPKGMVQSIKFGMWEPIFCANCGKEGGLCPTENMNFMFWLCNNCANTYGQIAGTMMMPDEVFWEQMRLQQLESYGRYLSEQEVAAVVEADASPLAKLIKSRRQP